jgi:hypothetical protein
VRDSSWSLLIGGFLRRFQAEIPLIDPSEFRQPPLYDERVHAFLGRPLGGE